MYRTEIKFIYVEHTYNHYYLVIIIFWHMWTDVCGNQPVIKWLVLELYTVGSAEIYCWWHISLFRQPGKPSNKVHVEWVAGLAERKEPDAQPCWEESLPWLLASHQNYFLSQAARRSWVALCLCIMDHRKKQDWCSVTAQWWLVKLLSWIFHAGEARSLLTDPIQSIFLSAFFQTQVTSLHCFT